MGVGWRPPGRKLDELDRGEGGGGEGMFLEKKKAQLRRGEGDF